MIVGQNFVLFIIDANFCDFVSFFVQNEFVGSLCLRNGRIKLQVGVDFNPMAMHLPFLFLYYFLFCHRESIFYTSY